MNIPKSANQLSYKALGINNIPLSLELNLMIVVWKLDFFKNYLRENTLNNVSFKKNRFSKEDNQFGINESNGENTWTSMSNNNFFKKCTKLGKKKLSCFLKKK